MCNIVEERFSDPEVVKGCIRESWGRMSSRETTFDEACSVIKTLSMCFLHCPENLRDRVESSIVNARMRLPWFAAKEMREVTDSVSSIPAG